MDICFFLTQPIFSLLSPSLSWERKELEVQSRTAIKLKLRTGLTCWTNVIDGICQQCQDLVYWLIISPTCITEREAWPPGISLVAMWHSQLQKFWDCVYNSYLWKYPKRKKKGRNAAVWFGWGAGRKHSSMAGKLSGCYQVTIHGLFVTAVQEEAALPASTSPAVSCQPGFSVTPSSSLAQGSVPSSGHICVTSGAWCKASYAKRIQVNSERGRSSTPAPESCR